MGFRFPNYQISQLLNFLSGGGGRFRRWRRPLEVTFLAGARDHRARLQILFDQIFAAATRALLGDRLVRRSELALRIISAAVEGVALARALFNQVAVFALRALHANVVLLDVLAFGISAAGRELAEPPVPSHDVAV